MHAYSVTMQESCKDWNIKHLSLFGKHQLRDFTAAVWQYTWAHWWAYSRLSQIPCICATHTTKEALPPHRSKCLLDPAHIPHSAPAHTASIEAVSSALSPQMLLKNPAHLIFPQQQSSVMANVWVSESFQYFLTNVWGHSDRAALK